MLRHPQIPLSLAGLIATLFTLAPCGCDTPPRFDNVVPAIGALGPIVKQSDSLSELHLFVVDYDTDPVDVLLEVRSDNGEWTPIQQSPGAGHGLIGLTSDAAFPGRHHIVLWDTSSFDPQSTVEVRGTPDDRRAGIGVSLATEGFVLGQGLPEAKLPDSSVP